jgi:hypothetical protein
MNELGRSSAAYLRTLIHNLHQPTDPKISETFPTIEVEEARIPLVREVIYRRTVSFLRSLEAELAPERRRGSATTQKRIRGISVHVFQSSFDEENK